jgi:hypothetical protein
VPTPELREVEQWFMARGTPHLTEGYSASEDVFTRLVPALSLIALLEIGGALNADFAWWQNLLAVLGGVGLLVGMWALVNRARRQPAFTRPARVRFGEIAVFVVVPALAAGVLGGQVGQALVLAAVNAALLGGLYLVASYGLVPMSRWALGKTVRELGAVAGLVGRALPLLLLIQIVLFINTEMWQVADGFDAWFLGLSIALFFVVGLGFLLTRLPRELGRLATFADSDELRSCVAGTPAEHFAAGVGDLGADPASLSRRQRGNVMLVALFSQGIQVVLVAFLVFAFFVVFGLLTITPQVIESWIGHGGDVLATQTFGDREVVLTAELLKLSAFLAAFSGLYFTVVLVTDATYREEFFDAILEELRQTLGVRVVYLRVRNAELR